MCTAQDAAYSPYAQAYNALKDPDDYRVWIFDTETMHFRSCELNEYSDKPVEENINNWEIPELNHGAKRIKLSLDRWKVFSTLIHFPEVVGVPDDQADSLDPKKFIEVTHGDWLDEVYYHEL